MASGQGSNAKAIIDYFRDHPQVKITHLLSNNKQAGALKMAEEKGISSKYFSRKELYDSAVILDFLQEIKPDLIVLAGFMWKIPSDIVRAFPNKIINIHPALLPNYGGKGMYGHHVHNAVLGNKETETGISIHFVNEFYDEGQLIDQFKIDISPDENLHTLTARIKSLEHKKYPELIEKLLFPD